ncbi:MAG: hypothetical protein IJ987_03490, partial [Firmicutes bacterium]|nr:hypothetical protein [Bacillota bacterium]
MLNNDKTAHPIGWAVILCSERLEDQHETGEDEEEAEIKSGEHLHIVASLAGVVLGILGEGDQAGQRGDQSTGAADVHTYQQVRVVVGELGQQDSGGNIADELAGQH